MIRRMPRISKWILRRTLERNPIDGGLGLLGFVVGTPGARCSGAGHVAPRIQRTKKSNQCNQQGADHGADDSQAELSYQTPASARPPPNKSTSHDKESFHSCPRGHLHLGSLGNRVLLSSA